MDEIVIDDMYQAASVMTITGLTPTIERNGNDRVFFRFPFSAATHSAMTTFYGGATGPLYLYARNLKTLRSKMFAALREGKQ